MAKTYIYKDTSVNSSIFDYVQYKDVKVPNTKLLLVRGILSQYLSPEITDKKYVNAIDIYWNNPVAKLTNEAKSGNEINLGIYTTSDLLNYIKDSFSYNNINTNGLIKRSDLDDYMNLSSLKTDIDYYILQINNILDKRFSYIDKNETNPGYNSIERGRKKRCLCRYTGTENKTIANADDLTYNFISFKDSGDNGSGTPCLKLDWEVRIDNKASENDNNDDNFYSGTHDFSTNTSLYLPENKDDKRFFSISVNNSNIFTIQPYSHIPELSDKIITIKLKQHNDENSAQLENLEDVAELTYECIFLTNDANNDIDTRLVVNDIQYKGQSLYDDSSVYNPRIEAFNNNLFNDLNGEKVINVKCGDGANIRISYYYYFRWYDHITNYGDTESTSNGPWHGAYIFRDPSNENDLVDKYIIISNDIEKFKELASTNESKKKIIIRNLNLLNDEGTGLNPNIKFYDRKDIGYNNTGGGSPTYKDENGNEKTINLTNLFEYTQNILNYSANAGNSKSKVISGSFNLDFSNVFTNWKNWKQDKILKYETKLLSDKLALNVISEPGWESTIKTYKQIPNGSLYSIANLGSEYYYDSSRHPMFASYFPGSDRIGTVIKNNKLFSPKFNVGPDTVINYYAFIGTKTNWLKNDNEFVYKEFTHAPIIIYKINNEYYSFVHSVNSTIDGNDLIFVRSKNRTVNDFFIDYTETNSSYSENEKNDIKGSRILYKLNFGKHEQIRTIPISGDSVEITTIVYAYYNQRMKGYKIGGEDDSKECWEEDNINWWKSITMTKTYNISTSLSDTTVVNDLFGLSEYDNYDSIYKLFNKEDKNVKKLFCGEDFTYGNPSNLSYDGFLRYYDDEGNLTYSRYYGNGKNSWLEQVGKVGENILVENYLKNKYYHSGRNITFIPKQYYWQ